MSSRLEKRWCFLWSQRCRSCQATRTLDGFSASLLLMTAKLSYVDSVYFSFDTCALWFIGFTKEAWVTR